MLRISRHSPQTPQDPSKSCEAGGGRGFDHQAYRLWSLIAKVAPLKNEIASTLMTILCHVQGSFVPFGHKEKTEQSETARQQ